MSSKSCLLVALVLGLTLLCGGTARAHDYMYGDDWASLQDLAIDFDRILDEMYTEYAGCSLWSTNCDGPAVWTQVPGQGGPDWATADNGAAPVTYAYTGTGVIDAHQMALLDAVLDPATPENVLPAGRVAAIRASFAANLAQVLTTELTINDIRISFSAAGCSFDMRHSITTGQNKAITLTGGSGLTCFLVEGQSFDFDVPSLFGSFGDGPLLAEAHPQLDLALANLTAAYMTLGEDRAVTYWRSFMGRLSLSFVTELLPGLLEGIGGKRAATTTITKEDFAAMQARAAELGVLDAPAPKEEEAPAAVRAACPPWGNVNGLDETITVTVDIVGEVDIRIRLEDFRVCNTITAFANKFTCASYDCTNKAYLATEAGLGDLNGDGTRNLASYQLGGGDLDYYLAAECVRYPNPMVFGVNPVGNVVGGVFNSTNPSFGSWQVTVAMDPANAPYTYQLYHKGPSDGAFSPVGSPGTSATLSISGMPIGDNELRVRALARCATPAADSAVAVVRVVPTITISPQPPARVSFVIGEGLDEDYIDATVADATAVEFQWFRRTATDPVYVAYDPAPTADGRLVIPDTATVDDGGLYRCRVFSVVHGFSVDSAVLEVVPTQFSTALYDPYAGSGPLGSLIVNAKAINDITINTSADPPTLSVEGGATFQGEVETGVAVFRFDDVAVTTGTVTLIGSRPLSIVSAKDLVWTVELNVTPGTLGGGSAGAAGVGGSGGGGGSAGGGGVGGAGGAGGSSVQSASGTANPGQPGLAGGAGGQGGNGNPGLLHASAAGSGGGAGFNDPNPQPGSGGAAPTPVLTVGTGGSGGSPGSQQNTVGAGGQNQGNNSTAPTVGGNGSTGNAGGAAASGVQAGAPGAGPAGASGLPGLDGEYSPEALAYAGTLQIAAGSGGGGGSGGQGGAGGGGGGGGGGGSGGSGGGGGGSKERRWNADFDSGRATGGGGGGGASAPGALGLTSGGNGSGATTNWWAGYPAWPAVGPGGNGALAGTVSGGAGGAGGAGGNGGAGAPGAAGGGSVILAALGVLNLGGAVDVSAGVPAVAGLPGGNGTNPGANGNPGLTGFNQGDNWGNGGSAGQAVAARGGRGGSGGTGGAGAPGARGGNGGAGGGGGHGVPGMVKLQGSVILASSGAIRANNAASAAPANNGIVTLISNMTAAARATHQPSYVTNGAVVTGATDNDVLLKGGNPFTGGDTPLIGELASGPAETNGWLQPGFWNASVHSFGVDNGAELAMLTGTDSVFEGYDQVLIQNTNTSGDIEGVAIKVDGGPAEYIAGAGFADGTLLAGQTWTMAVPTGTVVEVVFAPTITVSTDPLTLECGGVFNDAALRQGVTADDPEDGDVTASIIYTGIVPPVVATPLGATYTQEFEVTDSDGLTATASRTVEVVDTTLPQISLNGPAVMTLLVNVDTYTELGAQATDNCEDPAPAIVGGDTVDTSTVDVYLVTYNYTDASGNAAVPVTRIVNVIDNPPAVITILGNNPFLVECPEAYQDPGATAEDWGGAGEPLGDISDQIVVTGLPIPVTAPGAYIVEYSVLDDVGNLTTEERTVIVADTVKPVITLNGPALIGLEVGATYNELGASASDVCDPAVAVVISGAVDTNTPDTYVLNYDATDSEGNAADTVTRTVIVVAELLNFVTQPQGAALYVDDPAFDLTAEFSGGQNPATYAWTEATLGVVDSGAVAGNVISLTVNPATYGVGTHMFQGSVTDDIGTADTDTASVLVATHMSIADDIEDAEVIYGANHTMTFGVVGGLGALSYQWQKDADSEAKVDWQDLADTGNVSGTETATLTITGFLPENEGAYRCLVDDEGADPTLSSSVAVLTGRAGVPAAGLLGLLSLAAVSALGGAAAIRRRKP